MSLPLDQWWFWLAITFMSPFILTGVISIVAIIGDTIVRTADAITGDKE